MVKIESLGGVGVFVRDQKKAKEFYTKKLGLKVRSAYPRWKYVEVGATKGGDDAGLILWQPTRAVWKEDFEEAHGSIGSVTGIGFLTTNLAATLESLKRKNVKVVGPGPAGQAQIATLFDPDGNSLFVAEPSKPKARRAGLQSLQWITVASRDAARTAEFYTKSLGMKEVMAGEDGMRFFSLGPRGTAIMPFTPNRKMYDDPKEYDEDMAHIGEDTAIIFYAKDVRQVAKALAARGVRFSEEPQDTAWGSVEAQFLDPDGNRYALIQS